MNIIENLRSIEYDKNEDNKFNIKSGIVWGHSKITNGCYPILYISKPKHLSREDFKYLLDHLKLSFRVEEK